MKTALGLLALFTLASPRLAAGPLPAWSYRTPTNTIAGADVMTGGLSFPNEAYTGVTGDAVVSLTPVYSWSVASADSPDRVADLAYQFGVELRDDLSATTAYLSFQGTLTGSLWRTGSDLQNTFTGSTAYTMDLGGRAYTVTLEGFDAPTGYGLAGGGAIWARVEADDVVSEKPTESPANIQTPEPTILVLTAAAMPVLAVLRSGRRKR